MKVGIDYDSPVKHSKYLLLTSAYLIKTFKGLTRPLFWEDEGELNEFIMVLECVITVSARMNLRKTITSENLTFLQVDNVLERYGRED